MIICFAEVMHQGIKGSQLVKNDSAANGFYSEEIQNEDFARFEAEMLPSTANKIPIQFGNKI